MTHRGDRSLRACSTSAARRLGWLILPPVPQGLLARLTMSALYFVGVVGAIFYIKGPLIRAAIGIIVTGAWLLSAAGRPGARWRIARWLGVAVSVGVFIGLLHFSTAIFVMFEWSAPGWLRVLQGVAAVGTLGTLWLPQARARVPAMLLLGTCGVLSAFVSREDGVVRCDDYLRASAQPGVEVLVPTVLDELSCRAGDVLDIGRYPRMAWEAPDGERFIVTTQEPTFEERHGGGYGRAVTPRLTGPVCELHIDPRAAVQCFGSGQGNDLTDAPEHGRVFAFERHRTDVSGTMWAFTRDAPLRVVATRDFPTAAGGGYYDPGYDLLAVGSELQGFDFLHPGDLTVASEPMRGEVQGGEIHYDAGRHAGILCHSIGPFMPIDGHGYLSLAFTGLPFTLRRIGPTERYPWAWLTAVWGCDWDPQAGVVYAAIANFGFVVPIDYDTGLVLPGPYPFIGPGARVVVFDKARRRLYISKWSSGDVLAVSIDSGVVLRRWFGGRWIHGLSMSRDQRSIFLTGNLGIVRIGVDF